MEKTKLAVFCGNQINLYYNFVLYHKFVSIISVKILYENLNFTVIRNPLKSAYNILYTRSGGRESKGVNFELRREVISNPRKFRKRQEIVKWSS